MLYPAPNVEKDVWSEIMEPLDAGHCLVDTLTRVLKAGKREVIQRLICTSGNLRLVIATTAFGTESTARANAKFFIGEFLDQLKSIFRKKDIVAGVASLLQLFCAKEKESRRLQRR